jgi:hypothetical protein
MKTTLSIAFALAVCALVVPGVGSAITIKHCGSVTGPAVPPANGKYQVGAIRFSCAAAKSAVARIVRVPALSSWERTFGGPAGLRCQAQVRNHVAIGGICQGHASAFVWGNGKWGTP